VPWIAIVFAVVGNALSCLGAIALETDSLKFAKVIQYRVLPYLNFLQT
jgi:hypothetical protein